MRCNNVVSFGNCPTLQTTMNGIRAGRSLYTAVTVGPHYLTDVVDAGHRQAALRGRRALSLVELYVSRCDDCGRETLIDSPIVLPRSSVGTTYSTGQE